MSSSTGSTRERRVDEPVHERVEGERVVRARREAEAQRTQSSSSSSSGGTISPSRASASSIRHRPRSESPGLFEIVRTSTAGIAGELGGAQHREALHRLDVALAPAADPRAARDRQDVRVGQRAPGRLDELRAPGKRARPSASASSGRRCPRRTPPTRSRPTRSRAPARPRCRRGAPRPAAARRAPSRSARPTRPGPIPQQSVLGAPVAASSFSVAATTRITCGRRTSAPAARGSRCA